MPNIDGIRMSFTEAKAILRFQDRVEAGLVSAAREVVRVALLDAQARVDYLKSAFGAELEEVSSRHAASR